MTFAEAIEPTRIHSVPGLTGDRTAWVTTRPCRAPHQTILDMGLIGGGHVPMPGEVSAATMVCSSWMHGQVPSPHGKDPTATRLISCVRRLAVSPPTLASTISVVLTCGASHSMAESPSTSSLISQDPSWCRMVFEEPAQRDPTCLVHAKTGVTGMLNDLLPMPRLLLRAGSWLAFLLDLLHLRGEFQPPCLSCAQADNLSLIRVQ